MWLVLPDSSVVDVSLPDDSLLLDWSFAEGDSGSFLLGCNHCGLDFFEATA